MGKFETHQNRRKKKQNEKALEDLEAEKAKLEFLRDSHHVWNALNAYIIGPHLDDVERDQIREAMLYLTRGE